MINLAIFASGSGSNAKQLLAYFKRHAHISINLVYVNNPKAGLAEHLKNDERLLVGGKDFFQNQLLQTLQDKKVQGIVLAGFLWLIPQGIIENYSNAILNIHPSLLPKYGGKGMYGMRVHEAVIESQEKKSGITIHLVNEEYDKGKILLQRSVEISPLDTAALVQQKVQRLEHRYLAPTVEHYFLHDYAPTKISS